MRAHLYLPWIVLLSFGLLPFLSFSRACSASTDDIFIMLWSGKVLGDTGWFVNYNYQKQEMASSILGVLAAHFSYLLAPAFPYLMDKLCGLAATLLALGVYYRARRLFFPRHADYAILLMTVATLCSPVTYYWAIGILAGPYYTLLLAGYVVLFAALCQQPSRWRQVALAAVMALLVLVRPETFWILFFHLLLMAALPAPRAQLLPPLLSASAFWAGLLLTRWLSFGYVLPNPAFAKFSLPENLMTTVGDGLFYLKGYYFHSAMGGLHAFAAGYAAFLWLRHIRRRWLGLRGETPIALLAAALALLAFDATIILMGGDWMMYHRLMMPAVPLHNVLLAAGAISILPRLARPVRYALHSGIWLAAVQQIWLPSVEIWRNNLPHYYADYCRITLAEAFTVPLPELDQRMMRAQSNYNRDVYMREFVNSALPAWLEKKKSLRILTYQAGLLPMLVRDLYPQYKDRITLIDTMGLIDKDVATLDMPKNQYGISGGMNIPSVLQGKQGELSRAIARYNPNMIYFLNDKVPIEPLEALGYKVIWHKPGAIFLIKEE